MNDWEAVQAEIERKRTESCWASERADTEAQARQRVVDAGVQQLHLRLNKFASDMRGHLHVGVALHPAKLLELDAAFDVTLSRKPVGWTLADRVLLVGVTGGRFYFSVPWTGNEREGTLGAVMDEVVREAAEIVAAPDAPFRTKSDLLTKKASTIGASFYIFLSTLIGLGAGIFTWIQFGEAYGIGGWMLGWIPGVLVGLLVGWLWGFAAVCGLCYWAWMTRFG